MKSYSTTVLKRQSFKMSHSVDVSLYSISLLFNHDITIHRALKTIHNGDQTEQAYVQLHLKMLMLIIYFATLKKTIRKHMCRLHDVTSGPEFVLFVGQAWDTEGLFCPGSTSVDFRHPSIQFLISWPIDHFYPICFLLINHSQYPP